MGIIYLILASIFICLLLFASQFRLIRQYDGLLYHDDEVKEQTDVAQIAVKHMEEWMSKHTSMNFLQVGLGRGLEMYLLCDNILKSISEESPLEKSIKMITLIGVDTDLRALEATSERMESFPRHVDLSLYHIISEDDIEEEGMDSVVWVKNTGSRDIQRQSVKDKHDSRNLDQVDNEHRIKDDDDDEDERHRRRRRREKHCLIKMKKGLFRKMHPIAYSNLHDWLFSFDFILSTESLDILEENHEYLRYLLKSRGNFMWCYKKPSWVMSFMERIIGTGKMKQAESFFRSLNLKQYIVIPANSHVGVICLLGEK